MMIGVVQKKPRTLPLPLLELIQPGIASMLDVLCAGFAYEYKIGRRFAPVSEADIPSCFRYGFQGGKNSQPFRSQGRQDYIASGSIWSGHKNMGVLCCHLFDVSTVDYDPVLAKATVA